MTYDASVRKDGDGHVASDGERPFWGRVANWGPYRALSALVTASPRRQFIILATFPILWLLIQHLGPMLQMLRVSLLDAYPVAPGTPQAFTFDNYMRFFGDRIFWQPFFRTLTFAAVFTFCTLIITYPVAYFLARHVSRKNQMLMLLLLLIPFWVGEIVRTYAIMILLDLSPSITEGGGLSAAQAATSRPPPLCIGLHRKTFRTADLRSGRKSDGTLRRQRTFGEPCNGTEAPARNNPAPRHRTGLAGS